MTVVGRACASISFGVRHFRSHGLALNSYLKLTPNPAISNLESSLNKTNSNLDQRIQTCCTACDDNSSTDGSTPHPPAEASNCSTQSPLNDEHFMRLALEQAELAYSKGEVPVGAVIVSPNGEILASAHNVTEQRGDPTAHAEMLCIKEASSKLQGWRLLDSTLYVTLEPCPMCAGALLQSRVGRVVYGARNTLLGADGSWIDMMRFDPEEGSSDALRPKRPHPFHPDMVVSSGVLEESCSGIMKEFFKMRRRQQSNKENGKE